MSASVRTPTNLRLRFTATDTPAKASPQPGRRVVLKNGLLGLAGFSRTKSRPADAESMPAEVPSRHAPSLDNLRADQVGLRALEKSQLAVGIYPEFTYDARGGGGIAEARPLEDGRLHVTFDPQTLYIPDVNYKSAKFLGAPMPPPFRIRIETVKLEGFIDKSTGQVELTFIANFMFTAGALYKAPPLCVVTNLTTEQVQGSRRNGQGKRLDADGFGKLVGVATVPKTNSWPIDKFLRLPDETFAVMVSQFVFPSL